MTSSTLQLIWSRHTDLLPRFDRFMRERERYMRRWCCPRCELEFRGQADWRVKTTLIETYNLVPGGRTWERRECRCGAVMSLPVDDEGGCHGQGRNP